MVYNFEAILYEFNFFNFLQRLYATTRPVQEMVSVRVECVNVKDSTAENFASKKVNYESSL